MATYSSIPACKIPQTDPRNTYVPVFCSLPWGDFYSSHPKFSGKGPQSQQLEDPSKVSQF